MAAMRKMAGTIAEGAFPKADIPAGRPRIPAPTMLLTRLKVRFVMDALPSPREGLDESSEESVVGVVDVVIWRWVVVLEWTSLGDAMTIDGWMEGTAIRADLAKFDATGVQNASLVGTHGTDTNKATAITDTERIVCILIMLILFGNSMV